MSVLLINGVDVSGASYGFFVDDATGHLSAPALSAEESQVFARPGAQTSAHQVEPRTVRVRGKVKGSDVADVRVKVDNLKALVTRTPRNVELIWQDVASRKTTCEFRTFETASQASLDPFHFPRLRVDMSFRAAQPYFLALTETVVGSITTTPVALLQGSAEVRPLFSIAGPATDPRLAVQDHLAQERGFMEFTGTVDAGETLVVDMDGQTVYLASDPDTSQLSLWTGGNFFAMPPEWWDYVAGQHPTATCSAGTMEARYTQAYQ